MIYFLQAPRNGLIKIGFTSGDPRKRINSIRTMSPVPLKCLGVIEGTRADELTLHRRFSDFRDHGEWFSPNPPVMDFIRRHAEALPFEDAIVELPTEDMERAREAAALLGISLSAFIRQAVLEKTVDTERRMKI